jgi:two-component system OmpR family sensor kinase
MRGGGLTSIRGQLVVWYLGVLAILLLGLGVFQWVTISSYLRSSAAADLRHVAYEELSILGPCFLKSNGDLHHNAPLLARVLGSPSTSSAVVTPSGTVLASRALGFSPKPHAWHLSGGTIHGLVAQARSLDAPSSVRLSSCPRPFPAGGRVHHVGRLGHHDANGLPFFTASFDSAGPLLLVIVPLGTPGHVVGYAILGRSTAPGNATVARLLLVFAIGALLALLFAALVALPIINRALKPLRRVSHTAQAIAAGELTERANLGHSRDEIGQLGEAFDTMVDRLQQALSSARASEERMRRFLADASHELRTPVTVLRGTSQVLLRRGAPRDAELESALSDMHEEAVRLSRLVDDLLTLSRLDAGQALVPQSLDVPAFLREFVDHYAAVWPQRRIRLDSSGLRGADAAVDPEALRRVLTNLIDNASRYSRASGEIEVTGAATGTGITISVADEGPGLTAEDARRVFDRFYRANQSRSRHSGGTGLGLSIVKGLVQQSGGSIELDTGPDRGTTVSITLPRARRPSLRASPSGEPVPA